MCVSGSVSQLFVVGPFAWAMLRKECVSAIVGTWVEFAAIKSKAPTRNAGLLWHKPHILSFSLTPRCHSRPDHEHIMDAQNCNSCEEAPELCPASDLLCAEIISENGF